MNNNNGITVRVKGKVQGVGFRPFIWRLAHQHRLVGQVYNDGSGVVIQLVAGQQVACFLADLTKQLPKLARIDHISCQAYHWQTMPDDFTIVTSQSGTIDTLIPPDAATCSECVTELFNQHDRRYHYPFINCTYCGPRFSLIDSLPYDRANTTMRRFELCPRCQKEYHDPNDRRFHAQPTACPACGPKIWCTAADGVSLAEAHPALTLVINYLKQGKIIAIKNLGGFHLVCDATQSAAIHRLRLRKNRPHQPFAVMLPDLSWLNRCIDPALNLNQVTQLLTSTAAPIVLLPAKDESVIDRSIYPDLSDIGVMLPANPLQHLLARAYPYPLLMTSANAKGQPPVLDNQSALTELAGLADYWLLHNRQIVQRVDDSVIRYHPLGETEMIRRSRGYVPDPLPLPPALTCQTALLALGADLKNTFCLINQQHALVSQHLGDLTSLSSEQQWQGTIAKWLARYQPKLNYIVADAHPNYSSHRYAKQLSLQLNLPLITVLHHHAHLVACLAEHQYPLAAPQVIGLVLDGLGYGQHGELWGGECLLFDYRQCHRLGGLPAAALPGGELASRQPWRNLLAHCLHFAPQALPLLTPFLPNMVPETLALIVRSIEQHINCPLASSAGRLFDAVACALGIAPPDLSWEGEAACKLESLADSYHGPALSALTMPVKADMTLDLAHFWQAWFTCQTSLAAKAYSFHHALADGMAKLAKIACTQHHTRTIVLSGGVLQNRLLRQLLLCHLSAYTVYLPHDLPCNDGGISYGQAVIALASLTPSQKSTTR